MLFQTLRFFYFFTFVFLFFHFVLKNKNSKLTFLFLASLFFYGFLDYRFVPLLLFTSILDFYLAKAISNSNSVKQRRFFLVFSIVSNLSVLGFFKYTQFLLDTTYQVSNFLTGYKDFPPLLNIFLPAGISFYTFQSMSYVIDIYRGHLVSQKHPLEFLTAVSFFPHLIAGPIVRASTLLNQFGDKFRTLNILDFRNGLIMFSVGFLKKGLGDLLAKLVDPYFTGARPINPSETWLAAISFTGQIYADFSGYMDMAIGLALMLGFTLPESFNYPYLSRSPLEFWRRWNISLSMWFKDYLYIPLGGNRSHHLRNIFITMALSGLWHGASWNFIFWGMYYGILMVITLIIRRIAEPFYSKIDSRFLGAFQWLLTFYVTIIGMTFQRIPPNTTFAKMGEMISNLTQFDFITPQNSGWILFSLSVILLTHILDYFRKLFQARPTEDDRMGWVFTGIVIALGLTLTGEPHAFIYFQM
ncbi:MAG: Alginate o-acetyltransferase algI [Pseudobdellovibrio sp.]|jgi:D-alanyl-lipoteichoic acid acyltransferase DltB (MBOAT superfamily)|nr:Alginate o-acetyltransferase algI [Pseudobdellovibrio sp.]